MNATDVTTDVYPYSINGDTSTSLAVKNPCMSEHQLSSGLWYKLRVSGDDQPMVAHTCSYATNFDTIIAVYRGCTEDEGATDCVTWNNDACYQRSLVSWRAQRNIDYYVFVTGTNNARGRFILMIEQRDMHPNSHCSDPIWITDLPFSENYDTSYVDETNSECRNKDHQHAIFFAVAGGQQDRKVIATTCVNMVRVNDTVIDVYEQCDIGTSQAKRCVAYNDDYCERGASVIFNMVSGRTYYIAVASATPELEGIDFSLSVSLYDNTENDECYAAKEIDRLPYVMTGNTKGRKLIDQTCTGSRTLRRGAWYRYIHYGPRAPITISTCSNDTEDPNPNLLDATIEVYRVCDDRRCATQANPENGCTTASFVAERGETYNVFITASDPSKPGDYFKVNMYRSSANRHSKCENALFIQQGSLPFRYKGNTILSELSYSSCDNETRYGVWVTFLGTGRKMILTTVDEGTGFDTQLELFERCPEEGMQGDYCLEVSDDAHGSRASEIDRQTESNKRYWLFINGYSLRAVGVFVLKIYEMYNMINSKCSNAVGIRRLPYYDYGLTTYCDVCNASCTPALRKGNWYEFQGNGHWVTVSTCHTETDFATEIEVYLGCTDAYADGCVAHNHDNACSPSTVISFPAYKDQLFFILVTGLTGGVMSEGFFGMTVTEGDLITDYLSSDSVTGLTSFEGFMISVGVLMGVGVLSAVCAVGYGMYKRRHVSYQEITS